ASSLAMRAASTQGPRVRREVSQNDSSARNSPENIVRIALRRRGKNPVELRADTTSLRRTHEAFPMSDEPEATQAENEPDEAPQPDSSLRETGGASAPNLGAEEFGAGASPSERVGEVSKAA